uniref:Bm4393 n=1 Tax=Brugia malayi TaxID=6279 RepID=A0A1I9FZS6_BRUMA|nr:Bm4393 [Brugia malayi]
MQRNTKQEVKHRRRIILPCVIPWEYGTNKYASQKGTGGFGTIRNASRFHFNFIILMVLVLFQNASSHFTILQNDFFLKNSSIIYHY